MTRTLKTPTLAILTEQEQAALEAYEQAQAAARAAREASDQRRAEALAEHDRKVLDTYDETEVQRAVSEAQDRLRDVVLADPVMTALRDVYAAELHAWHLHNEASNAASRLGVDADLGNQRIAEPPSIATVLRILEHDAIDRAESASEAREQARTAAGEAKA